MADTEFELALAAADPATALMLLLCRDAALRAATAYSLTSANIVAGQIHATTKNEGSVIVPISARLSTLLTAAISRSHPGQYLMLAMGLRPDAFIGNVLRHRLAALQQRLTLGDWTWHDLRRTAAHRLYERTGDLRIVQSLLGHKAMMTTLYYLNAQRVVLSATHLSLMASGQPSSEPDSHTKGAA